MAVAACARYGTHQMKNLGGVAARDLNGNQISNFKSPFLYQCGCGEYAAATGYAHFSGYPIGYYCTLGAIKSIGMIAGVYSIRVNPSLIYYTSATSLAGYRFIAA